MGQEYINQHLAGVFHTGVFCLCAGQFTSFEENPQYNPICRNEELRRELMERADTQEEPVLFQDRFHVFFVCVKHGMEYHLMGPLSIRAMDRVERHRFYHFYGIEGKWEKGLHYHTLMEVLQLAGLFAALVTGREYTDQQLVDANGLVPESAEEERQEQAWFDILSEGEDIYRHTYQEERRILDAVRDGDAEEAVRLSKEMDASIGRLGKNEQEHWKNLSIVASALCARAAIEGGLMPSAAYRISGFYINKITVCDDITQILVYRNHAIEELAGRVRELKTRRHASSYTNQCKDYVHQHFREKIYLEKIAETLGISAGYLSRLFKKETGVSLQDFITEVRVEKAANLLRYSEETLLSIAEYVNFPSQSYFGKVFKQKMKMTPRQYRERYKPAEFYGRAEHQELSVHA